MSAVGDCAGCGENGGGIVSASETEDLVAVTEEVLDDSVTDVAGGTGHEHEHFLYLERQVCGFGEDYEFCEGGLSMRAEGAEMGRDLMI